MTDLGILLALLCALLTNLGFLYKHRGANRAPDVDWRHPGRSAAGLFLGASAGILFGVSDVAIKAITGGIGHAGLVGGLLSPWLLTAAIASVIAFFASARGLQTGEPVAVITVTSAAATMTAIAGGIVVFGDPMPSDPVALVAQSFAFILVIAAAALTPAPLRAASQTA